MTETTILTPREQLGLAHKLCGERHFGQYDKQGMPYAMHPQKVMHYLKTKDMLLMVIALLHDICEDTATTFQELVELGFDPRVIDALRLLTKMPGQTPEEYLAGILTNVDAMMVKLADLRHNTDMRRMKGRKFEDKDKARTLKYYTMRVAIIERLMELGVEINI